MKSKNYKDKKWLRCKYWEEGLSQKEIAEKIGVNQTTIHNWLKKLGIEARDPWEAVANHVKVTNKLTEFLSGFLLGDGCLAIREGESSARYLHGDKHEDFVTWLSGRLKDFGIKGSIRKRGAGGWSPSTRYFYKSLSYRELLDLAKKWYPNGTKRIPPDFRLSPDTLKWWYIGDGSISGKKLYISSYSFTIESLVRMKNQMEINGIGCSITTKGIYIKKKSQKKFFDYILSTKTEIPPDYDYKFPYSQ